MIAICNAKGGVGKTTTTINLASYLSAFGKKVMLVDFDPQANASSGIGINLEKSTRTIYHGILNNARVDELKTAAHIENLHVIPANQDLAGALVELVPLQGREFLLRKFLNSFRHNYDYILIDLPPSLSLLTINGLVASDEMIIPVQSEYFGLEGLSQLLHIVTLLNENLAKRLRVAGALITMYDSRERLGREVAENIRQYFPHYVYETEIPRCTALAEAPSFGKPVILHDAHAIGAKAYARLAKEVMRQELLRKAPELQD